MTGRHRGPKRKLRAGYRAPLRHRRDICAVSHIFAYWTSQVCVTSDFSSSSVVLRAMRVFHVRASSSPIGYPCAKLRFCRPLPITELPRGEKLFTVYSITQSLSQSLIHPAYWMYREPKLSLRNINENDFHSDISHSDKTFSQFF